MTSSASMTPVLIYAENTNKKHLSGINQSLMI